MTPNTRFRRNPLARGLALVATFSLAVATAAALVAFVPGAAVAADDDPQVKRDYWQNKYRQLLQDRARFQANYESSNKNYVRAQRYNYPRGGARQQFMIDAQNAQKRLAETEEAIAEIFNEAREADVPPGWLYEVDDEPIAAPRPASPDPVASDEDRDEEMDREGRNPLYFKDEAGTDNDAP